MQTQLLAGSASAPSTRRGAHQPNPYLQQEWRLATAAPHRHQLLHHGHRGAHVVTAPAVGKPASDSQEQGNNISSVLLNVVGAISSSSSTTTTTTTTTSAATTAAAAREPLPGDLSLEPFKRMIEGKRFMCTMCGKCCTGSGEVYVSDAEVAKIAAYLNLNVRQFHTRYLKQYSKHNGWRLLRNKTTEDACIFLGADNKCTIHTVRPSQCSTYPWWPELMDEQGWATEKADICEGFDHPEAPPLSAEELQEAARQLRISSKEEQLKALALKRPPAK